ncbi:sulfite exporter TauE/SafE family protein [Bordetella bronchiseptica]|uniref:sulfite exporter TauE/SafE family protein n=1 Tax=Bordetella bronchiseptica TaxID=518 RepID=UPI003EDC5ED2
MTVAGLWLFAMALGASALGGMLGMASGIFIVPLLVLWGIDVHAAIAASIVSVIACSCGSAAAFLQSGLTHVRLAVVLETATTLGALTGVFLVGAVPVAALYALFAVVLVVSAWQMLARRRDPARASGAPACRWAGALRLHGRYRDPAAGRDRRYRVQRLPLGMSLMYGAGVLSALLGIGSGVLKIPAMDSALRLPLKVSSATSNFMIGVTAAASAAVYFARGEIDPAVAGPVALGSVAGSVLGARILMRVSGERLRLLFVAVLALLAVQMLLMALGVQWPGGGR